MKRHLLAGAALASLLAWPVLAADAPRHGPPAAAPAAAEEHKPSAGPMADADHGALFHSTSVASEGSVTVEGQHIDYRAVAGTLVVHPREWDDSAWREERDAKAGAPGAADRNPNAEASMFYVAYFKKGVPSADRPIMFLYNGGPGSATMWLHMGAFGPRRIVTADGVHTPAAPYRLVDNAYSLLDVADLVFIDAPGTGFSRIAGKDKEKAFYGVDQDAYAFSQFILGFMSKYNRWNSPKYLFGESYGTPRSAVLVNMLETGDDVDFNGVVLLSQVLNFSVSPDRPEGNPGLDQAYITSFPTYAATAWYHNRLPGQKPADLEAFLKDAEHFATTDYAVALQAGSALDPAKKQEIAQRMSQYIGLPVDYLVKADLRVNGGEFEKNLLASDGLLTGRLDTRFTGPGIDPLGERAEYDPQSAAISAAYVAAMNSYARETLGYATDEAYKPSSRAIGGWSFAHVQPGNPFGGGGGGTGRTGGNVMPDLAYAMKYNPTLKVMVNGGYYDLATPFYQGWYEDHHLPIPDSLNANIEYHYYASGHMVYAKDEPLKQLHDNVADFVRRTNNLGGR
jgi:carboxypeptidase C (cathepsin A)